MRKHGLTISVLICCCAAYFGPLQKSRARGACATRHHMAVPADSGQCEPGVPCIALIPEPAPEHEPSTEEVQHEDLARDLASYESLRSNGWGESGGGPERERDALCTRLDEELRGLLPEGYLACDAALLEGSSMDRIHCAVLLRQDPERERGDDQRVVVLERHRAWVVLADSGPFQAPGFGAHLAIQDLDSDGSPEIGVSGVGCTTSCIILLCLQGDRLSRISFPDEEHPDDPCLVGACNLGPEDADGDGIMEIVNDDLHPDRYRTRWIWRLEGNAYRRWRKLITDTQDDSSHFEPWGPGER